MLLYRMHRHCQHRSLDPQDKGPHPRKYRRCPHRSPGRQHMYRNIQTHTRRRTYGTLSAQGTCRYWLRPCCNYHIRRRGFHMTCHCKPYQHNVAQHKSNRYLHRCLHRTCMGLRTRTGYRCPHRSASHEDTDHCQRKARRNRDRSKGPPGNCPQHR